MNVITITGTCHYHGQDFITPGMKIRLIKEPDNEYDREAIRAEIKGLGKIGYVGILPDGSRIIFATYDEYLDYISDMLAA